MGEHRLGAAGHCGAGSMGGATERVSPLASPAENAGKASRLPSTERDLFAQMNDGGRGRSRVRAGQKRAGDEGECGCRRGHASTAAQVLEPQFVADSKWKDSRSGTRCIRLRKELISDSVRHLHTCQFTSRCPNRKTRHSHCGRSNMTPGCVDYHCPIVQCLNQTAIVGGLPTHDHRCLSLPSMALPADFSIQSSSALWILRKVQSISLRSSFSNRFA